MMTSSSRIKSLGLACQITMKCNQEKLLSLSSKTFSRRTLLKALHGSNISNIVSPSHGKMIYNALDSFLTIMLMQFYFMANIIRFYIKYNYMNNKPTISLLSHYRHFAVLIIIMVIFKCYFSREHIALSYKKWCGHRIRKNQQIKSTAHDGKSYFK